MSDPFDLGWKMKPYDRAQICHTILVNAGVEDYWLADSERLVVTSVDDLTALQCMAVRVATGVWSGRLEPEVAVVLGFA